MNGMDWHERVLDDHIPQSEEDVLFLKRRLEQLEGYEDEPGMIAVWEDEVDRAQRDIDHYVKAQEPVSLNPKPHVYMVEKLEKAKGLLLKYQTEAAGIKKAINSFQSTKKTRNPEDDPNFKSKNQSGAGRLGVNDKGETGLVEFAGYPVIDGKINGIPWKQFKGEHTKWMVKRRKGEAAPSIFSGK